MKTRKMCKNRSKSVKTRGFSGADDAEKRKRMFQFKLKLALAIGGNIKKSSYDEILEILKKVFKKEALRQPIEEFAASIQNVKGYDDVKFELETRFGFLVEKDRVYHLIVKNKDYVINIKPDTMNYNNAIGYHLCYQFHINSKTEKAGETLQKKTNDFLQKEYGTTEPKNHDGRIYNYQYVKESHSAWVYKVMPATVVEYLSALFTKEGKEKNESEGKNSEEWLYLKIDYMDADYDKAKKMFPKRVVFGDFYAEGERRGAEYLWAKTTHEEADKILPNYKKYIGTPSRWDRDSLKKL